MPDRVQQKRPHFRGLIRYTPWTGFTGWQAVFSRLWLLPHFWLPCRSTVWLPMPLRLPPLLPQRILCKERRRQFLSWPSPGTPFLFRNIRTASFCQPSCSNRLFSHRNRRSFQLLLRLLLEPEGRPWLLPLLLRMIWMGSRILRLPQGLQLQGLPILLKVL